MSNYDWEEKLLTEVLNLTLSSQTNVDREVGVQEEDKGANGFPAPIGELFS